MSHYSQQISRQHKACFLFLLDQSYSMVEPFGNDQKRKCDALVDVVNDWLHNMAIRASDDEGIREWMDIGVWGYRTDMEETPIIESALAGELAGKKFVSINEIGNNPQTKEGVQLIPDEATGEMLEVVCEVPAWVEPMAAGGTPMCTMLYEAYYMLEEWIKDHRGSFPPIVIHITDGEATDCEDQINDPIKYAESLRSLQTNDGNVLLLNCHVSAIAADPIEFPGDKAGLPAEDQFARVLFDMSSPLPETFIKRARGEGYEIADNARGMAFNMHLISLIHFLDMGTRIAPGLR